jgi:hypothetical protein
MRANAPGLRRISWEPHCKRPIRTYDDNTELAAQLE